MAARNFVNADLQVDKHDDQVHISAIFKWFVKDFGGKQGVMDFLLQHLDDNERKEWIETNRAMIEFRYKNYDWGLNSAKLGLVN